ncbi:LysR family transcriptional regulator [Ruegeria sp.]|uniref:LysR family transcriptional regulator n=1 Tax=Ruegeria sp. TaxID=1879320 RepID=UPI00231643B7|nr:LysR family transcriptional regulator [Ruegeria sp.]MDA7963589.1 LysR family transcriptional regulator [Ruegeria sp.]
MRTTYLETLLAVHRFGSFSTAAQSRNMTLSALSMQMKTLEDDLGAPLFDRSFRPPKLTPVGEKVALEAKTVVEAEARLRSYCSENDTLSGQFHIGVVTSMAARSLSAFLRSAASQAPLARFSFETGLSEILCQDVRAGSLDAAIVTEIPEATAGLVCDGLYDEEMVLISPLNCNDLDHEELARNLPFFHFRPNSGIGRLIAKFCTDLEVTPKQSIYLDNIEAIVNCVRDGLGYSLLPKEEARRYGGGNIRSFSCPPKPFFRTISLVSRSDPLSDIWRAPMHTLARSCLQQSG